MRDLSGPPPDYRPLGWRPGGFTWIRPWSQLIRLQNGRVDPTSRNGLHSGTMYLGPVPGPHASLTLQTGSSAPSATQAASNSGVQTSLPISPSPGFGARPTVIGPQ